MSGISGVVCGVVESLEDELGLGRIKVRLRGLPDEPDTYWARVAAPLAGPGRGFQMMPELGDEVLLAFDRGDLRLPFVIGYLWNGEDKPPRQEPAQRTLQTVSGHVFELDDTPGSEKISLLFKGGTPSITLEQDSIEIKLNDSSFVKLEPARLQIVNATLVDINP